MSSSTALLPRDSLGHPSVPSAVRPVCRSVRASEATEPSAGDRGHQSPVLGVVSANHSMTSPEMPVDDHDRPPRRRVLGGVGQQPPDRPGQPPAPHHLGRRVPDGEPDGLVGGRQRLGLVDARACGRRSGRRCRTRQEDRRPEEPVVHQRRRVALRDPQHEAHQRRSPGRSSRGSAGGCCWGTVVGGRRGDVEVLGQLVDDARRRRCRRRCVVRVARRSAGSRAVRTVATPLGAMPGASSSEHRAAPGSRRRRS